LYTYVACVYSKCFICFFRHTLQVFLFGCYIYFCNGFSSVFRCFYKCFRRMLQVFQLFRTYVTNVSFGCFKSRSSVISPSSPSAALSRCLLLFSMLVMSGRCGPSWMGRVVRAARNPSRHEPRAERRPGASLTISSM